MKVGFATSISLHLIRDLVEDGEHLPAGQLFGPSAYWVRELMKRGHHVTVYTSAREVDQAKTFRGDGITIRIAKLRAHGTGRDLFALERKQLTEMMVEDRCDVIHAHWTYEYALAALAARIPTLITIHDLPWKVLYYFRDMHRVSRLLMAYSVALRGKYFTAVSKDAALHFQRYFTPLTDVVVITNGLGDEVFELGQHPAEEMTSEFTFATILKGWSARKNAAAALRAFQSVHQAIPRARLLMIGTDYEAGGPANRWATQERLDEGVRFVGLLGYQEMLRTVRDKVQVVVHPSLDEAFSMAALEAMALEKPVIAGEVTPGMAQMLDSGNAGVLVNVKDPAAIAAAMIRLAQDNAFRAAIAHRAYERVASNYRIENVIAQYDSLYVRIANLE